MLSPLRQRILAELDALELVDPHTHIDPRAPASTSLADILGYHYYTELAHSAGMPSAPAELHELPPQEKVASIVPWLANLNNTVQMSWLIEMLQRLFSWPHDCLRRDTWESAYELTAAAAAAPDWADKVLNRSNLAAVFLTSEFDDSLEGFDTQRVCTVPAHRTTWCSSCITPACASD